MIGLEYAVEWLLCSALLCSALLCSALLCFFGFDVYTALATIPSGHHVPIYTMPCSLSPRDLQPPPHCIPSSHHCPFPPDAGNTRSRAPLPPPFALTQAQHECPLSATLRATASTLSPLKPFSLSSYCPPPPHPPDGGNLFSNIFLLWKSVGSPPVSLSSSPLPLRPNPSCMYLVFIQVT